MVALLAQMLANTIGVVKVSQKMPMAPGLRPRQRFPARSLRALAERTAHGLNFFPRLSTRSWIKSFATSRGTAGSSGLTAGVGIGRDTGSA